ncbi:tRNA uridine-5-carboxymethylaminomethyl(34) synthesis GTPase MnmE [Caulobacter sp. SLTY]|uniref:tRNA uridine-5-carboxymethylaminomethyl(34) synthesis GTPase MnmE n=1 Tax=Caulobacter sp. SLTY TaxID=2683262 RepID=UPI0014122382|nr:tRNA uridine-5-carboxymethylaminomethyl(34) synthesis GTPase MnmE [Caulobacter sp. SLTY]NBB17535.1 tRNA uridine-5-carboxymethylaminomethyl(34) synthesis GTPase MnmE [Caulobacter sp. SLTY]
MTDTVFALATAPGRAAVAVVRLSGPASGAAVEALSGKAPPPPRRASLRRLRDSAGATLDEALVLWTPGPASYTGEDSAELHLHGGPAIVEGVMAALLAQGLRLAEPGEFTRRAFENGRLDLAQAEAVADLVDAETQGQARQALGQLGGALSNRYETWRAGLTQALAMLEAAVDFPDEELPADVAARARPPLETLLGEIDAALADEGRGRRVREGFRIALIGAPNAGKSSLLNALAGRDAAIVTATPGTTRDVIEVPMVLAGYKALLADTAGVRETDEAIEAEGVRRAQAWAHDADLRLWVVDQSAAGEWARARGLAREGDLLVLTKADLTPGPDRDAAMEQPLDHLALSVLAPADVATLRAELERRIVAALSGAEFPLATRIRHRDSLTEARRHMRRALDELEPAVELAAEDVRLAARALARVTGRIGAEDILDVVFSSFCIGK